MLTIAPVATRAVLMVLNPASSTDHPPILRHPQHYPGAPVHAAGPPLQPPYPHFPRPKHHKQDTNPCVSEEGPGQWPIRDRLGLGAGNGTGCCLGSGGLAAWRGATDTGSLGRQCPAGWVSGSGGPGGDCQRGLALRVPATPACTGDQRVRLGGSGRLSAWPGALGTGDAGPVAVTTGCAPGARGVVPPG
jgi:hypothetical protein